MTVRLNNSSSSKPTETYGKIIVKRLQARNLLINAPSTLDFDVIDDLEVYKENRSSYRFTQLVVHEGEIEDIELWDDL